MGYKFRRAIDRFRRKLFQSTLVLVGFSLVAACGSGNLPPITVASANAEVSKEQAIAAGDRLKINVFGEPALTGEFEVDSAGLLIMPLIDPLVGADKTPAQLTAEIRAQLVEGGYVLNPRVSVEQLDLQQIYILGEVTKPGQFPYSPDLTYLQVVALAGGFTPRADRGSVLLQRRGWDKAREVVLDDGTLRMAPGDTLLVRQSLF